MCKGPSLVIVGLRSLAVDRQEPNESDTVQEIEPAAFFRKSGIVLMASVILCEGLKNIQTQYEIHSSVVPLMHIAHELTKHQTAAQSVISLLIFIQDLRQVLTCILKTDLVL